jgi:hypothetical protein
MYAFKGALLINVYQGHEVHKHLKILTIGIVRLEINCLKPQMTCNATKAGSLLP